VREAYPSCRHVVNLASSLLILNSVLDTFPPLSTSPSELSSLATISRILSLLPVLQPKSLNVPSKQRRQKQRKHLSLE
jgi:hypothetical protein